VPQSEKFAVEQGYGLAAKLYASTREIDHIVSLDVVPEHVGSSGPPWRLSAVKGSSVQGGTG
jgi:hypothetical protein